MLLFHRQITVDGQRQKYWFQLSLVKINKYIKFKNSNFVLLPNINYFSEIYCMLQKKKTIILCWKHKAEYLVCIFFFLSPSAYLHNFHLSRSRSELESVSWHIVTPRNPASGATIFSNATVLPPPPPHLTHATVKLRSVYSWTNKKT